MRELPEKTKTPAQAQQEKLSRFYVMAPRFVQLSLQQEAAARDTTPYHLGGIVLERWLLSGCPDFGPQVYEPQLHLPEALPLKPVEHSNQED